MKKLAIRVLLLGLPFGILLGSFELNYAAARNNQYLVKRQLLSAVAKDLEVLVLGSSHGYYDILPGRLNRKAFNLAALSQSTYYDVQLAMRYVDALPALKVVVLPISYFTLETELDQGPERWRCYYYYKFYGIPHRDRHMAGDARNFMLYFLFGRDYPFVHRPSLDVNLARIFDARGGLKLEGRTTKWPATRALMRHHDEMRAANLPENQRLLEMLAIELQKRKVRLLLITPPVTAEYRQGMRPAEYTRMQEALHALSLRAGVTYRNYLADDRFAADDFVDADHLSDPGAIKFSELMARELL